MSEKPTVRDAHRAYIESLSEDDVTALEDDIVDNAHWRDDVALHGTYSPWRVMYPLDDIESPIYQAPDTTEPTIGNNGA